MVVSGRQILRVIYSIDGKLVKTLTKPNSGSRYKLAVTPSKLSRGTHRVLARMIFRAQSGTRSRALRAVFSRCARKAVAPAFTGLEHLREAMVRAGRSRPARIVKGRRSSVARPAAGLRLRPAAV